MLFQPVEETWQPSLPPQPGRAYPLSDKPAAWFLSLQLMSPLFLHMFYNCSISTGTQMYRRKNAVNNHCKEQLVLTTSQFTLFCCFQLRNFLFYLIITPRDRKLDHRFCWN